MHLLKAVTVVGLWCLAGLSVSRAMVAHTQPEMDKCEGLFRSLWNLTTNINLCSGRIAIGPLDEMLGPANLQSPCGTRSLCNFCAGDDEQALDNCESQFVMDSTATCNSGSKTGLGQWFCRTRGQVVARIGKAALKAVYGLIGREEFLRRFYKAINPVIHKACFAPDIQKCLPEENR